MAELAQFPLGSVLLPGRPMALQIFEPRYVKLLEDLENSNSGFGVVLISRGSEVGGDDVRSDVGTAVEVTAKQRVPGDRWLVEVEGRYRYRVLDWLPDDPYPRAMVEAWPLPFDAADDDALQRVAGDFRQLLSLISELGIDVAGFDQVEPGVEGLYQMAGVIPITAYDQYQILAAPTGTAAVEAFREALVGATELVRLRLAEG